jgi:hypothetical protein
LPAIEELLTAWENKANSQKYAVYAPGLQKGIDKIRKYYSKFDQKPSYILALGKFPRYYPILLLNAHVVLHPYFKLTYIKMAWGGAEEQAAEIAAGNLDAKNWQDEARKVVERTASSIHLINNARCSYLSYLQMEEYWHTRPSKTSPTSSQSPSCINTEQSESLESEFN